MPITCIGLSVSIIVAIIAQICIMIHMFHRMNMRCDNNEIHNYDDEWERKRINMYNLEDTANIKLVAAKGGKKR